VKGGQQTKCAGIERRRVFDLGDECSRALLRLENPDGRQRSDTGTKSWTAYTEQLRKIALGRQTIARCEVAALDHLPETRDNFLRGRTVFLGVEILENASLRS
jgi:hypothetical protein